MTKPVIGWKPLKFETPEDLIKIVQKYFNETDKEEWTITWLSLVVWSKQLINDYEAREWYKEIIKEAKLLVEHSYEIDLKKSGRTGTIFALKNFDWKDKTETELSWQVDIGNVLKDIQWI